jgi:acetyl esterase/lipase
MGGFTYRRLHTEVVLSNNQLTVTVTKLISLMSLSLLLASCVVPPASSQASRSGAAPHISAGTVEYSPGLTADLYLPQSGGNRGVIVLVHAGGFYTGSRHEVAAYARPVMDQIHRGFAVLNIDYRLTSGARNLFPTAVADVSAAIDWTRTAGPNYGVNPATVIVAGHSAGGTLAALIGLGANNPGSPRGTTSPVDGWIAISGIYDLRLLGVAQLQQRLWLGPAASTQAIEAASAITLADSGDAPGYIVHGVQDLIVPFTQSFSLFVTTWLTGKNPWLDLVSSSDCNGHIPTCAMNTGYLNIWIDQRVR